MFQIGKFGQKRSDLPELFGGQGRSRFMYTIEEDMFDQSIGVIHFRGVNEMIEKRKQVVFDQDSKAV